MEDVDIIFAGGGAAACVAAGRLARADPNLKILVVERGRNNFNDPTVVHTALSMTHLHPGSTTAIFYRSKPSEYVGGREIIVPAGGMLGGGSSINLGMYTRAQAADYDAWDTPGWTADDMIPLCNKTETYYADSTELRREGHGADGPIHISDGGFRSKATSTVMETITRMGMKELGDINDFKTIGGFMKLPRYVSPEGKRQDGAHCYLHPLLQQKGSYPNLQLLLCSTVTRVLFDHTTTPPRAIGVEYCPTEPSHSTFGTVRASKLVVVSAGGLGSPQILERSGVGNATVLEKLGIPIIVDLPGVGENYQDHHNVTSLYKTSLPPEETLDSLASGRKDVKEAIATGDPHVGWNSIDVAGKLRPDDHEVQNLGPGFLDLWNRDWASYSNKPMVIMGFINVFSGDPTKMDPGQQHLTIGSISLHPYSRGSIHIADRKGSYDFDSGFMNHDADVKMQLWSYKRARAIARALPYFEGEVAAGHPEYPEGSAAAVGWEGEIVYSDEDNAAIEDWIRKTVSTTWHSLGTCAMRPRDADGVVDARLNVYGTQGLKVADMSIAPENIGANVGNTAFAIGEKAAVLIAEEMRIDLDTANGTNP